MIIEKTKNQILIKSSPKVYPFGFQRILDYLEYLEITAKSNAKQSDADNLADTPYPLLLSAKGWVSVYLCR